MRKSGLPNARLRPRQPQTSLLAAERYIKTALVLFVGKGDALAGKCSNSGSHLQLLSFTVQLEPNKAHWRHLFALNAPLFNASANESRCNTPALHVRDLHIEGQL